jgi:hypothetical protein
MQGSLLGDSITTKVAEARHAVSKNLLKSQFSNE